MNKQGEQGGSLHGERTPEQIEKEIELTRERMSRDLDALGDKLSPSNLRRQAKDALGSGLVEFARHNPLPVAAAGLGALWLMSLGDRLGRLKPRRRSRGFAADNPLAVAAGAAILGVCVGLLVSPRKREHGWTRPTGDKLMDRARKVAKDLREEAPSVKEAATAVGAQVKRVAKRAKEEAKRVTRKE
jgi:Protein of unknown function (DUF3618)